ncbi:hypothetical protein ACP0HM_35860 [Escherichia coli]
MKGYVVEMSGSMTHWKTILSKSYYPIANLFIDDQLSGLMAETNAEFFSMLIMTIVQNRGSW